MYTQTIHCLNTQCTNQETTLTIAAHTNPALAPVPTHCPWCGSTDLIDDKLYHTLRFIQSLEREGISLTVNMYNRLYARFRSQSAFTDFREYVNVVFFDDPVETHKAREARLAAERKARETSTPAKFKHTKDREPGTPLLGQFGGSAYPPVKHIPGNHRG